MKFDVIDSSGNILSVLTKITGGCLRRNDSEESAFILLFPENATPKDKALLLAATLFIDYSYFEETQTAKHEVTS